MNVVARCEHYFEITFEQCNDKHDTDAEEHSDCLQQTLCDHAALVVGSGQLGHLETGKMRSMLLINLDIWWSHRAGVHATYHVDQRDVDEHAGGGRKYPRRCFRRITDQYAQNHAQQA